MASVSRVRQSVQIGVYSLYDWIFESLRSLVKESIETAHFWQVSIDFHKFHIEGAMSAFEWLSTLIFYKSFFFFKH